VSKKVIIIILTGIIGFGIFAAGIFFLYQSGRANPGLEKRDLEIGGEVFEVEIANTTTTRSRGLSYRDSLGDKKGMLFIFPYQGKIGFWMKDMNFAIDMVWINKGQVVGVTENAKPESKKSLLSLPIYYPPREVDMVLEINAGEAERNGIKEGTPVRLSD
jgi:uncharacterized membrane protein (UPF0127 family)